MDSYPKESRFILNHQGVGFGLILVVEGVEIKVLFVSQETLSHQEGHVVTVLQFAQEVVVMEAVYFFNVTKDNVAVATHRLGNILA